MKWKDVPMWPPEWRITDQGSGEEGMLESVYLSKDKIPARIYVLANYHCGEKIGIIYLENSAHLDILCHRLKKNIGKSLKEIGDLEVDFGLSMARKVPRQIRPRTTPERIILTKKSYTKQYN
jgi:hypothetical protein